MGNRSKKENSDVCRVVAYLRVSTDQQVAEGFSLEAQQAKVQAYAAAFGLELVGIETDAGLSASSLERPGLQRALERLDDGSANALLVVKLDRLTRNVRDLCDLVDTYFRDGTCSLLSVGENIDTRSAAGRMMLNMLTVIGQWEREAIGERTAAAMQHMKAAGLYTGGWPPFGFKLSASGVMLEEVEGEQGIIAKARSLRAKGLSLRAIAIAIGPNPRNGKFFGAAQIVRML